MKNNSPQYKEWIIAAQLRPMIEDLRCVTKVVDEETGEIKEVEIPVFIRQPDGSYIKNNLI